MIKYSILMLTHNRLTDVQRCFASLMRTICRPDVQFVVLDNASTDGTQGYVASMTFGAVLSQINSGVAGGRARLLSFARGEYVVFLDSDTAIIDDEWLDQLGAELDKNENVGMAGPGGSFVLPDWSGFTAGVPGEVDVVAGYCQCFRRNLLDMGVKMDTERYAGFWTEDSDFCMQIRALGWDVVCKPVGISHHPAHSGLGQDMTLHDKHIAVFREKWRGQGLVKSEGAY